MSTTKRPFVFFPSSLYLVPFSFLLCTYSLLSLSKPTKGFSYPVEEVYLLNETVHRSESSHLDEPRALPSQIGPNLVASYHDS